MKICVISTNIFKLQPPQGTVGYSGLESLAWHTAKGLAEKGHKVSLICPEGSLCPNVEIISLGPERTKDEHACYNEYWQRLTGFDVIIDHTWNKWSVMLRAEGVLKAPCLLVTHAPVNTMLSSLPPIDKPCFVCISQDQANHFEALFSHSARVCHNGIDPDFYSPMDTPRSDRYLFLARFSTIKGADLAQDAALATNVGLDLVGDTQITQEPEYLEQCKKKADGKQIKILGGVSRGECVYWFSQAKALLHPNQRFREPLGLAPLEAMACGAPCIAFNFGAMRETIKDGETGFLVGSLEEMKSLIKNDAVSSINRNRCREWVCDNFSLQKMINRYEELCIEATSTGGW